MKRLEEKLPLKQQDERFDNRKTLVAIGQSWSLTDETRSYVMELFVLPQKLEPHLAITEVGIVKSISVVAI